MKRILLALVLVLALAVPAMAEVALSKDFTLDGHFAFGYIVSSDYSTDMGSMDNWITSENDDGSTFSFMTEVGVTWKDKVRPFVLWNAVSGTGANGDWTFTNYVVTAGIEYFLYKTDWGKLALFGCYNQNGIDLSGAKIQAVDVGIKGKERNWILGVDWRF